MDFSWLSRPWGNAHDTHDQESVVDSPNRDRSYDQSNSDLLNESQHDGDNHEPSSTNALDFLKLMSEQLMSAWAQEYPEWREDIDAVGAHALALADRISRQRQERVYIHDDRVEAGNDASSEEITGTARSSLFPDTQVNDDGRTGYLLNEGGGATFSIHAPGRDKAPAQTVAKCSPSTVTSTTLTTSMGRPLMSSEPYSPDVCGRGMLMEQETSLHGRIWVPSSHSTPDEHRQVPYGSSTKVRWSDDPCYQSWRLVSDDRPQSRGNRHRYTEEQDWRSVPDFTDAHNQQSSTSQGTGRMYDANFAGQDVSKGFVFPRERDEPPWRDMRYAPSPDRQHRPRGVGQPLPSDQASRVIHRSDTAGWPWQNVWWCICHIWCHCVHYQISPTGSFCGQSTVPCNAKQCEWQFWQSVEWSPVLSITKVWREHYKANCGRSQADGPKNFSISHTGSWTDPGCFCRCPSCLHWPIPYDPQMCKCWAKHIIDTRLCLFLRASFK